MAESDELLRLDNQVCFLIYAAANLVTRRYRPALDELGLSYPQYLVMLVLWEEAPSSVGHLGKRLFLDSGTLTPLLKRMERAELITRERDPADERRVLINLTEAGRALRARAHIVPETLARNLHIDRDDARKLRDMLGHVVKTLAEGAPP
ncbi:MarR family winged helix-turn-helix transcriptional regulator [Consotaella salsifontis]|uniref:Transcriptional regulator, MarR family n=1 Tax=Consotaella salsifontis TaxID=1365950 RepID=A0A1T4NKJ9_9HYPH|nr:MarR family transcriptional regulator [Consotaella salsifontis]SJZ79811.1 transcriptional regulator, MarR family [Consotaella salsifontis]